MKRKFIIIPILLFSCSAFSQEIDHFVIAGSGEYSESSTGSLSWTLGETAVESYQNGQLSQGFQQGMLIVETAIGDVGVLDITCYPNPTTSTVRVKNGAEAEELFAELYAVNGDLLASKDFVAYAEFDFTGYSSGSYILLIVDKRGKEKQFTIQKY